VQPGRAQDTFRALAERRADRKNRAAQLDARRKNIQIQERNRVKREDEREQRQITREDERRADDIARANTLRTETTLNQALNSAAGAGVRVDPTIDDPRVILNLVADHVASLQGVEEPPKPRQIEQEQGIMTKIIGVTDGNIEDGTPDLSSRLRMPEGERLRLTREQVRREFRRQIDPELFGSTLTDDQSVRADSTTAAVCGGARANHWRGI
jgi:hypothetical protein